MKFIQILELGVDVRIILKLVRNKALGYRLYSSSSGQGTSGELL
jgi:hypothetical protein